mmetsp:Transcript_22155/g.28683  ORF Transcript_22155/g.28683 Transcript_22155/m.28683 type:complete len:218 (-) Transcript_22155:107-760(-)
MLLTTMILLTKIVEVLFLLLLRWVHLKLFGALLRWQVISILTSLMDQSIQPLSMLPLLEEGLKLLNYLLMPGLRSILSMPKVVHLFIMLLKVIMTKFFVLSLNIRVILDKLIREVILHLPSLNTLVPSLLKPHSLWLNHLYDKVYKFNKLFLRASPQLVFFSLLYSFLILNNNTKTLCCCHHIYIYIPFCFYSVIHLYHFFSLLLFLSARNLLLLLS